MPHSRPLCTLTLAVVLAVGCGGRQSTGSGGADVSPYQFHRSLAVTLLRTGQARQAVTHIRKLQELRSDSAEPFYLMGRAYVRLGVSSSAQRMFERAVAIDPELAGAHATLAVLLDGQGNHQQAEEAHHRAIALTPDEPSYHNNLGFNLYVQGRAAEAALAYEEALRLDAGVRRVHNNIGFAYSVLGDMERAHSHFRLAGTPAEAENNLGFAYEARGELAEARDHYRAALLSNPELGPARANLDRVCSELGCEAPDPAPPQGEAPATGPQIIEEEGAQP